MAVRDSYNETPGTWTKEGSPKAAIIGVSVMAIFILLIACFNLTNSSIAISSRRLKEIGLRKVLGSLRKQLIVQFIGETAVICLFSLLLGMLIAEYLLIPAFNNMWEFLKLESDYTGNPGFLAFLVGALLFTALLAGAYPAFYVSKFQPTEILKGKAKFGGNNFVTYFLLFLQFSISVLGIVCATAFVDNARYQESFDLGFNKESVIYTYVGNRSDYETYRNVLAANPDIISIAHSPHNLYSSWYNDPIKHEDKEIEVDIMDVGDNYLKTIGLNLVAGRDFVTDSETDRNESVIVTEGLARKFGWTDPIGKEVVWMDTVKLYVVGVIADVYNRGLWEKLEPLMIRYARRDRAGFMLVNAPASKMAEINTFMETKWKEMFPNRMYNGRYMDEGRLPKLTR
ncbi:MAG: FtsX-like permease family protein [Bacteroidia bacterium]|nr:FtsX-like permease family protein [Bacteroidia bacterium]